jgi:uncharacterized repeat protein (TIGR03806 family)
MRTFEALFSVFAQLFLILEKGVAIAVAILVIVWSPWNARADFHVMLRTSLVDGAAADEVVSWKDVTAFVSGAEPSNRYGTRLGSTEIDLRCVTTDLGGGLVTLQAATGSDGIYDVYRWRDPYRFAANIGTFDATKYNVGRIVGMSAGADGRFYLLEDVGGVVGARKYRLKYWTTIQSFLSFDRAVVEGERSNVPDLVGFEMIDGQLYGVSAKTVGGRAGYEVRRWAGFSDFLNGSGTVVGARAFNGTIVEVFAERHGSPASEEGVVARRPLWGWLGNKFPTVAPGTPGGLLLEDAFPGLTFQNPIKMVPRPRSANELWVIGREGHLWAIQGNGSVPVKTQVLNLTAVTMGFGDSGLLGFAFHPDFGKAGSPNRGYVYVAYNFVPSGSTGTDGKSFNRLSRFTMADGATTISRATEMVMINQFDEHDWHNQGDLFFGSDGFLYMGVGDEGGLNNQYGNAQSLTGGLFSGLLRLDVDQNPARSHPIRRQPEVGGDVPSGWPNTFSQGYGIPNDNPWQDVSGGMLEEFWAIGLRNPYRVSQDPVTGAIFTGEVGQTGMEEVDRLVKGGNYQWSFREGTLLGPDPEPTTKIGSSVAPYFSYSQADGNRCVIGGYVYRGSTHAATLGGQYVFGDYVSGRIWSMRWEGVAGPEVRQVASTTGYSLSGFGIDQNQEIYVMSLGFEGRIFKLTSRTGSPPSATLSATGAFEDLATLKPARGVLPYSVNAPLFSDNAAKKRWIVVPNDGAPYGADERVTFQAGGPWSYPNGTVLIKHFELPVNDANPAILRRLETRFMVKAEGGTWYGVTYKWRADGSEADLLVDGLVEDVPIATTSGGTRVQAWTYPSRSDCMQCHNVASTQVLGLRTWQLNGVFAYPGTNTTENQLRVWSNIGLFDQTITATQIAGYLKATGLRDESATVESRVRSYIDSNCAHCHLPGGAQAQFDGRFSTPLAAQNIVNGAVANSLGVTGAQVVKVGSLAQSLMHVRFGSLGASRMPPIAKNTIDTEALNLMARWINNLAVPVVPQSLGARAVGVGVVELNWVRGSNNEDRFVVRRSLNGSSWNEVGTLAAGVLQWQDRSVAEGVSYYYQVAAANELGASAWTAPVQVTAMQAQNTWAAWQQANGLGGQNGPLQNPDGDSAMNLLEFGLGEDAASGGAAQDRFRLVGNGLGGVDAILTRPEGRTGVTMKLMVSGALSRSMVWLAAGVNPQVTRNGDGTESLLFASLDQLPGLLNGGRGFVRVEVTLQSSGEKASTATWFWDRRGFPQGIRSFGPAMLQRERFSGRVSAGSVFLDVGASAGEVSVAGRLDGNRPAFLEVVDGAYEGHRFDIDHAQTTATRLALSANSLRNTRSTLPDLTGARFVVRDHWSLESLFPKDEWTGAASPVESDRVRFYDSTNSAWQSFWLGDFRSVRRWVLQGDVSLADQGAVVVPPGAGALVQRVGSEKQVTFFGVLRANAFALPAGAGTSFLAGGWPADESPTDRSMLLADGFTASNDPALADRILLWTPDRDLRATQGYDTFFLLRAGQTQSFWVSSSNSNLQDLNQTLIFSSHRAFFVKLQVAKPNWKWPMPWVP